MSAPLSNDLVVTVTHLHSAPNYNGSAGFCSRGARAWADAHGLSWADFVRNGIAASVLTATGDAMALRLVEHARQQTAGEE
ncbi:MAG: hypothetical protein RR101_13925 [Burkholderiaceae bacterium]